MIVLCVITEVALAVSFRIKYRRVGFANTFHSVLGYYPTTFNLYTTRL